MGNQNLNILDEVNKGATMGMDAISFVSEKVEDSKFKQVLDTEYNKYKKITKKHLRCFVRMILIDQNSFN